MVNMVAEWVALSNKSLLASITYYNINCFIYFLSKWKLWKCSTQYNPLNSNINDIGKDILYSSKQAVLLSLQKKISQESRLERKHSTCALCVIFPLNMYK